MRHRLTRCVLIVLLSAVSALAVAQDASPAHTNTPAIDRPADGSAAHPFVVGVKVAPPFVMNSKNHYHGLSVQLWEEVAADHGWHYTYQPYDLEGLLDAVSADKVDVGLGAITATAARERRMDFAHPITSSGLGIAVRTQQTSGWLAVAQALVSAAFLKVIGALALLLFGVGVLIWLLERRHNPEQFGQTRAGGLFAGFWWAMVTMTTVGYGDIAPRTVPGRLLGMAWMLSALLIVSFFTASITSALTVGQLSTQVDNADDLAHLSICSVPGSTSAHWLDIHHYEYNKSDTLPQALAHLRQGDCQAAVYDKPLMRWMIAQHYQGKLRVLALTLARQDYAFALPQQSPLREAIDASLLQRINAPSWPARLKKYMGAGSQ
ncbi:transporter substrate-binding domain-containing protein [Oleiagrimonas sp. C23AA]|uniref:transporter substrate-binding domain-containing protein n=1 Tax=Oleiagrimonas sp. C23AA TaxID=2719047 RepID=UPI00142102C5|nr:transporter substrate-binding domain-containing protein [Oleiagrimonas sp. C23AA]NII09887.1 transporter substrate-binding domain-containing protein [Oleiagrimonas sp. C23AA]